MRLSFKLLKDGSVFPRDNQDGTFTLYSSKIEPSHTPGEWYVYTYISVTIPKGMKGTIKPGYSNYGGVYISPNTLKSGKHALYFTVGASVPISISTLNHVVCPYLEIYKDDRIELDDY